MPKEIADEVVLRAALDRVSAARLAATEQGVIALAEPLGQLRSALRCELDFRSPRQTASAVVAACLLGPAGIAELPTAPAAEPTPSRPRRNRKRSSIVCCERELLEMEGAGHDPDCPGRVA